MDDFLHVGTKAIWAPCDTFGLEVSVPQQPTLPLHIPSSSHLHQTCQLYCEASTCRRNGRGHWSLYLESALILAGLWTVHKKLQGFFSQRKDCTKSVQSIPVAAVLVLAATAPVQGGMCSPGAARAELECNSGAAPTPKQAIKRIHLVPNYLIHFCSVLKTLCKKAFCLKARQGLALSSGFQWCWPQIALLFQSVDQWW